MSSVRRALGEAVRTVVESLERRTLLTTVTLPGSEDPDTYAAYLNTTTNNVDFYVNASPGNGSPYQSVPASQLTKLVIAETGDPTDGGNYVDIETPGLTFELQITGNDNVATTVGAGNVIVNGNQALASLLVYDQFQHTGGVLNVPFIEIETEGYFRDAGGSIASNNGVEIDNYGTFRADSAGSLANTTGWFFNAGHVISDVGSGNTATVGMAFYNAGASFNLVSGELSLSGTVASYGNLQLDGTAGTLSAQSYSTSAGAISLTGGTFKVTNTLQVGSNNATTASLSVSGGMLNVGGLKVAESSRASLTQSGGSIVAGWANVGVSGTGTTWQMTGGTATLGSLGYGAWNSSGASSTLNFTGGSISTTNASIGFGSDAVLDISQNASWNSSGQVALGGWSGTCTVNQSGGAVYINDMHLAQPYNSTATYNLSDGTLDTGDIYLTIAADWEGDTQHATFHQTGGIHRTGWLSMGTVPHGTATYLMDGGSLYAAWVIEVGGTDTETNFIQTAGTSTFNQFMLGDGGGGVPKFSLSGGTVNVLWNAYVGSKASGRLDVSGGVFNDAGSLVVSGEGTDGSYPNGHGTVNLSGTGQITSTNTIVGYGSNGAFNQSGGTLSTGYFLVNGPSGTVGTFSHTGGTTNYAHFVNVLVPTTAGNGFADEGSPYQLNLSATSEAGNNAINSWSVNWGDGGSASSISGNPSSVSHTYASGGVNRTINATAFGGGISYPTTPQTLLVRNLPPSIGSMTTINVAAGTPVNLLANFTEPGTGQTHTAAINWGDGTISTTQAGTITLTESGQSGTVAGLHTFNTHGTYTATVYITDSLGGVSSRTVTIEVGYVPPALSASGPSGHVTVGDPTPLTLTASGPEASGITAWKVDWGDNTINTYSGNGVIGTNGQWVMSQSHAYAVAGSYTITAWAIDSQPDPHLAGTVQVTVDVAPLTSLAAPSAVSGSALSSTEVRLSWHDNSSDEDGFKVYASENGGAFSLVQTLPLPHTGSLPAQTAITSLTPGSTYAFYVTSYRGTEESNVSKASLVEMPTSDDVSLAIIGPSSVTANATVRYKAIGPTDGTGDPTYVWSVLLDGKSVKSGQGADFSYVATDPGDYTVQLTRLKANTPPVTISRPLTVTYPKEAVLAVSGPAISEVDRISVFLVDYSKLVRPSDGVVLEWTVRDQDGDIVPTVDQNPDDAALMFRPSTLGSFDIGVIVKRQDGSVIGEGHFATTATEGAADTFTKAFIDSGSVREVANQVIEDAQHRFITVGALSYNSRNIKDYGGTTPFLGQMVGGFYVSRFATDLTNDQSFGTGGMQMVPLDGFISGQPVIRQIDDGSYLIVGLRQNSSDGTVVSFVKLGEDGQLNDGFGQDGIINWEVRPIAANADGSYSGSLFQLNDMVVTPDGKIYVAGTAGYPGYENLQTVLCFNADGTLDDGTNTDSTPGDRFGANGSAKLPIGLDEPYHAWAGTYMPPIASSITVAPDGAIYVGGTYLTVFVNPASGSIQGGIDASVAKLHSDGALDTSFGNGKGYVGINLGRYNEPYYGTSDEVHAVLIDSKGRLIVQGVWGNASWGQYGTPRIGIARLLSDGSRDPSFGSDTARPGLVESSLYGSESGWSAAVTADDKIVVAGAALDGGIIARFNEDGSPDVGFGNAGKIILDTEFDATWQSVIIASDNDIVVAGNAVKHDSETNTDTDGFGIAKYRPGDKAVTDLTATATVDGPIDLNWVDAGTGEDGFLVLRSTSPSGPSLSDVVGTVARDMTSWTDVNVVPGQRYYYKVVAFDTDSNGNPDPGIMSNVATAQAAPKNTGYVLAETVAVPVTGATVESALSLLAGESYKLSVHGYFQIGTSLGVDKYADAQYGQYNPLPSLYSQVPKKIQFGIGVNDEQLDLNRYPFWGDPSTDAAHTYSISYSPETSGKLKLNFHDSYYPDNQPGYYMMVDVYRALPGVPETVNANTDRARKRIDLTWNNVAVDATRILVQRSVNGSAYATIATLPASAEAYSDPNIAFNTEYSYRLIARNEFGESDPSSEAVAVMVNAPPKIEAISAMTARAGSEFSFAVNAEDPDDATGTLVYALSGSMSEGAVINSNGEISGWTPTTDDIGQTFVWRVTVQDADGGTAERYAVITVAPALSTIPVVTTQPYVVSQTDTTADVSVLASDDGPESALRYKWVVQSRPFGVRLPTYSVNDSNSAKNTTITFYAAGTYKFQVQVSDGTDYYGSAELTITVVPVFSGVQVIDPLVDLAAGASHPFKAVALDQFGRNWDPNNPVQPTITWSASGTAGGQIDSATGVYQAPSAVTGAAYDEVIATATSGSVVEMAYGNVRFADGNQAPVIDTDANNEYLIDAEPLNFTQLRLTVVAHDPDGPASDLTYTWTVTPAGSPTVTFTENGTNAASTTIANCPENAALNYTFTVTVTDKHGGKASTYIELTDTREFKTVELAPKVSTLGVGKTTTFTATAKDQYDRQLLTQPAYEWKVDGVVVPGQTGRTFDYTAPTNEGQHTVTATATSGGVAHAATADVTVVGQRPPVLLITSPSKPNDPSLPIDIEQDTAVNLVVDDVNDDPVTWYLWLKPTTGNRILLSKGDSEVGSAPTQGAWAAAISPTVYADGNYTLQLTETDDTNAAVVDQRQIRIHSNYKIGSLRLPFVDAQIDVPNGTPLTATRVYDSMLAGVEGEFGYGWTLEKNVSAADFRITAHSGEFTQGSVPAFRTGDLVYLKTPDGQQHVFAFVPKKNTNASGTIANVISYSPRFVAVDGSRAELNVAQTGNILGNSGLPIELRLNASTGEYFYSTGTGNVGTYGGYNPVKAQFGNSYSLKTDDGTVYQYDGSGNLSSSTDPNGNVTSYSGSGSAAGRTLQIRYDSAHPGRITGISDVPGFMFTANPVPSQFVEYGYDAAGDLVSVRDRSLNVTTFEYEHDASGASTHRLLKIIDSRGVHLVTASYDPDSHLLTAVADSSGKGTNVVTAPLADGQAAQSSKDAAGNKSEVIYNDHGDVIREIKQVRNPSGAVTGYEVTVHEYGYGENNSVAWQQADKFGLTNLNKLLSVRDYASFTVDGVDTQGLRYSKVPESNALTREVTFNYIDITSFSQDNTDAVKALFQPYQETSRGEDGQLHTTTYHKYDGPGKPAIIESPDGQLTWMLYDSKGRLEYTISGYDRNGQANALQEGTKTEYDAKGRVIGTYQVTATGGSDSTLPALANITVGRQLTSSTYYASTSGEGYVDKLASTTNSVTGLTTYYSYNADGQSKAVMREWQQGGVTHQIRDSLTEYDASGRVYRVYDSENKFTETHYNDLGQVDYTVDKFDGKTAMVYDARGQVIRTIYPDGTETRTAYDDLGRAAFTSDRFYSGATISTTGVPSAATETSSLVTRTVYDSLGRATDTERYKNAVIAIDTTGVAPAAVVPNASQLLSQDKRVSVTSTTYDSQGRVATTTDAAGTVTKNQYIANGGLQSVTTAYGTDNASATSYAYHQTSGTMPATAVYFDSVTDGKQHTTKTYKDANGRAVRVEYHDGSYVDTLNSPTGVAESAYKIRTLNATTGLVEETVPVIPTGGRETITVDQHKASDTNPPYTINVYDAAGRLTDLYLPSPDGIKVSPHWHYAYDANGNLVQQVDANGHVTSFTYDDRGNRTSRTMPPDSDGNTANDTESWQYDAYGRIDSHIDFMGHSTKYVYDDTPAHGGRLSEEQRFVGAIGDTPDEKTAYHYDDLGRQDMVTEFTAGNMSVASRTTAFAFDPVTGGTTQVASSEGVLNHAYDPATGRLTRTWTANTDTTYNYDKQGRLWKVIATKLNGQTLATPRTTEYTYDAAGSLLSTTQDGGTPADASDDLVTTNTYDTLNRLETLVAKRGGVLLFDQDYSYTSDGQKHDVLEHRYGSSGTLTGTTRTTWGYDANGRLLSETRDEGADGVQNGGDYTDTYTFDLNGNRLGKTHDAAGTANDVSTVSVYNDRDELTASTTNGVTTTSTYDANGNTLTDGTNAFTWDLRNRMTGVTTNGVSTTYAYDENGIRVSKKVGTGPLRVFVNDTLNPTGYSKPLEEKVNGTIDTSYAIGLTVLGQANPTTGYLSLVQDGQGKTRSVLNVSGVDVQPSDYDAYGNALQPGQTVTPWQNPDGYTDFESGLTRQGVRDLDRTTGTWTSQDPTIFGTGEWRDGNLRIYVGGSPLIKTDSSGLFSIGELLSSEGLQNQLAELRLPQAFSVYNTASNLKEASQILAQVIRGAPFDTVSAILFASQFLPLGKVLSGLGSLAGKTTGSLGLKVAAELNELYQSAKGLGKSGLSQFVGETASALVAKAHGLVETEFRAAYHGIDSILKDGAGNFVLVEAKGGYSPLRNGQLGANWIRDNIEKVIAQNVGTVSQATINNLRQQVNNGTLKVMLTQTPIKDGVVQETQFFLKPLAKITDKFFG
ncbi:MAG: PKD domain-containing protein [Tepidisphaeraceae bacterium]